MSVLDASALLAFLQGGPGADRVEELLVEGATCSAANWSEVAQEVLAAGRDWQLVRALLDSYPLRVEPVLQQVAEWAAARWHPGEGLSLADRLCLALSARLGDPAVTADTTWGTGEGVEQLR